MVFGDGQSNSVIQIWDKMGYNSASAKRYLRDLCIYIGVFGVGPSNTANEILPRPTLVAMATKFETKRAIIRIL